jgi:hypothetical protein
LAELTWVKDFKEVRARRWTGAAGSPTLAGFAVAALLNIAAARRTPAI